MSKTTGAENVRWDLNFLYSGIDDPQIDSDLAVLVKMAKDFNLAHKGKLEQNLGEAISDYMEIDMLANKVFLYLSLRQSTDVSNSQIKAKIAKSENLMAREFGENLTFFTIELIALSDETLNKLYEADEVVRRHRRWIEQTRVFKRHILSEPIEAALAKRSSFGTHTWADFFRELENDLEFEYQEEKKTLTEMVHLLSRLSDPDERFKVMTSINDSFKGYFGKYSAQTLYMQTGSLSIEVRERAYKSPMDGRNKSNMVPDDVVDILHKVVQDVAGPFTKRYYKLKARHLGLKTLRWSDRNAPMPFADTSTIPFDEALSMVLEAYQSFSPTLAEIIKTCIKEKRIDAPAGKGRVGGAFNHSVVLPGNVPASFTFLNYLGSRGDAMTLAHELGHGVHGILAGQTQGTLMAHAPVAYCETASVFGEMTTFNFMKKRLQEKGDTKALLTMLMAKIDDSINTVVRQIGFSNFERRIHGMDATYTNWSEPEKYSVGETNSIWLETLKPLYGEDGEVFTYENAEYLWAYVHHFHNPFYVYGYSFGEIFTQSLYALAPSIGARFEELYLDLLRSGSTKNVVELMEPFGLDPTKEEFWIAGINNGLGSMVQEAERLSKEMGI